MKKIIHLTIRTRDYDGQGFRRQWELNGFESRDPKIGPAVIYDDGSLFWYEFGVHLKNNVDLYK